MKEYIGSDEHFEDEINADYDERERRDKEQQQEINKQIEKELFEQENQ